MKKRRNKVNVFLVEKERSYVIGGIFKLLWMLRRVRSCVFLGSEILKENVGRVFI